jgi:pectate lyase/pectin methylesterase-like acyl-CoA thioesterase
MHSFFTGTAGAAAALAFTLAATLAGTAAHAQTDPARQAAPADGWAALAGGTRGGANAESAQIYTVANRVQLQAALDDGGGLPKIVKVVGTIDMSEGRPYLSRADQASRGNVRLPSNTTLIGAGPGAGFVNAQILISGVSQVIVRNLKIVAPCDVAPTFDPSDGVNGSWNAAFDAISVIASNQVWIDRNTITDVPVTDDTLPIENGQVRQCHDGAIDITQASDYVTVSYNVIEMHNKTMLIGGSDSHTGDAGRLRVTVANNLFRDVVQRSPRVRYGQVHLFNNLHLGSRTAQPYPHSYSVGVGKAAKIISTANAHSITGAASCADVVAATTPDADSRFADSGSTLNGVALAGCAFNADVGWSVPYVFRARPAGLVRAHVLATAGAGRFSTAITGTGNQATPPGTRAPAIGDMAAQTDTRLSLAFDNVPTLGTSGFITVRRASDGAVVDTIDISTAPSAGETQTAIPRTNMEIDAIGRGAMPENAALARWVWYRPLRVVSNRVEIQLRDGRLAHGTAYTVSIDPGVISGTIFGQAFNGVSPADGWTFTTRAAPTSYTNLTVDDTGSTADFRSLQGALNWVMRHCSQGSATNAFGCNTVATPKLITVANGRYREFNMLRRVLNLTIRGESREGVVIGDVNFESFNSGSGGTSASPGTAFTTGGRVVGRRILLGGRASMLVEGCDLLTLENFTFVNPHLRVSTFDNQAEVIYFNTSSNAAAGRMVAKQMTFLSQQDTLQIKGYVWVYQSLVEGNVDFIWGGPMAALFEESEIRSVRDTSSSSPGFILQARAIAGDKGYVFLNSRLTAGPGVTAAYLARSGGTTSSTYVDNIAFINSRIGPHILPVGWCVGTGTSRTGTGTGACGSNPPPWAGTATGAATDAAGWREWGSMDLDGNPLNVSQRLGIATVNVAGTPRSVVLAKQLDSTAGLTTRAEVFANSTAGGLPAGWNPVP